MSEILNIVHRRKKQSERTTLSDLRDHFSRRPYGWYQNAIWSIAARLYKRGKVELRQDSNLLDDDAVLNALLNNRFYSNTLLEPQIDIDPRQVKALSEVYNSFFDEPCPAREAKDVATVFQDKLKDEYINLSRMLVSKDNYPFLSEIEPVVTFLDKLIKKEFTYYLTSLKDFEYDLLDYKEKILDPIKRFWNGEQKKIFDSIQQFFSGNQSNLDYIECEELTALKSVIDHPKPYTGTIIKDAKTAKDRLTAKVLKQIEDEKEQTKQESETTIAVIQGKAEFAGLEKGKQELVLRPFYDELQKLNDQRFIANLRETRSKIRGRLLEQQLNEMIRLIKPPDSPSEVNEPKVHYMRMNSVRVDFPKSELQTKEDVEKYIEALKVVLADLIKQNKRISL